MSTTVTLYAADSYVDATNPTTNYGSNNKVMVGIDPDNGHITRGWVKFDLSSIPAGSTILSATLYLRFFMAGQGDYSSYSFNIQRCTDTSWTESGITWNNAPNGSCLEPVTGSMTGVLGTNVPAPDANGDYLYNVREEVEATLAGGAIGWRIKNSKESETGHAYLSTKEYTASYCARLVVTYGDSGTEYGYTDVPILVDGYIYGTYTYDDYPYSRGITVADTQALAWFGNSSSAGRDVDQAFWYPNTALSNLHALGMPSGATITGGELHVFCNQAVGWMAGYTALWVGQGVLGSTITLPDWDCPGCTNLGDKFADLRTTGWKPWPVSAAYINTSGYTNFGLVPGAYATDGAFGNFSTHENTDENEPFLRVFWSKTIAGAAPKGGTLPLLAAG